MEFAEEDFSDPEQGGSVGAVPRQSDKQSKSLKANRLQKRASNTDKRCSSCGTTTTPVWRWGGEAKEILLCNACSLRIRRSTGRPNSRAKSPGERLGKRNQSSPLESSESGGMQHGRDILNHEQLPLETEEFRAHLNDIVSKERDRLLGIPRTVSLDDLWMELQWPGSDVSGPSTPRPPEWEPFPSIPQYSYDGLSETGRLDFGSPATSNLHLDQGLVGEIFS